jgi:hypothetical protein
MNMDGWDWLEELIKREYRKAGRTKRIPDQIEG